MKEKPSINEIEKLIKQNSKILFIQDVYQILGISSTTFYNLFPVNSVGYNVITNALEANKTATKQIIRERLLSCKSPAALISLYRLLGTPEERKALNQRDEEVTTKQEDQKIILKIE